MKKIVIESINIYNTQRSHYSNYTFTDNKMHEQNQIKIENL